MQHVVACLQSEPSSSSDSGSSLYWTSSLGQFGRVLIIDFVVAFCNQQQAKYYICCSYIHTYVALCGTFMLLHLTTISFDLKLDQKETLDQILYNLFKSHFRFSGFRTNDITAATPPQNTTAVFNSKTIKCNYLPDQPLGFVATYSPCCRRCPVCILDA